MYKTEPDAKRRALLQGKLLDCAAYVKAFEDIPLLKRPELRPVRLQLELMKPELAQQEHNIVSTIVVFGSARTPALEVAEEEMAAAEALQASEPNNPEARMAMKRAQKRAEHAHYYSVAREFSRLVSSTCQITGRCEYVVVTGGGPGIMEAANRGAYDIGAKSIGLNIELPFEQAPNPFITPELCFNFHYFAIRKMHFLIRAKALVAFPGGFGTLDELFEALTLIQTLKIPPLPVILVGRRFWNKVVNFDALVEEGVISPKDIDLFDYAETAEDIWKLISDDTAEDSKIID
jgi:uncharacterized protein (TIGR00730 family)